MTIKNLYPSSRPQSIYNVINGRPELPAASTFSRASEATYVDGGGIIRTAPTGEPRFNYDPVTGEFLGLLLEPGIKNRMLGTGISTEGWTTGNTTLTREQGIAPNGKNEAVVVAPTPSDAGIYFSNGMSGPLPISVACRYSCFYKLKTSPCVIRIGTEASGVPYKYTRIDLATQTLVNTQHENVVLTKFPNGWLKVAFDTPKQNPGVTHITNYFYREEGETYVPEWYMWGPMVTETPGYDPAFIECNGTAVTTSPDIFSLTTSTNFDGGSSLLLDSETTTEDFLYKIKASGTVISELKNDNGTLEWDVNGTSAQTDGLYPQVGFVNGRVRTVSSFGAADGEIQNNYLYTTGISFPTPAVVAPGADELEFGTPQTLKALYLWSGQLSDTEAVSVIKGEYNVVPYEPIIDDSYSFVFNTDPTDIGETSISLPNIVPTVSMFVDWGDGQSDAYSQGVIPSHTYPYPGQYRIQIVADDGFDNVRLGNAPVNNVITRVDQWAPQHRVGQTPGFSGEDMVQLLAYQSTCKYVPPFEYTNLTGLDKTFVYCFEIKPNNWDWIPYVLPECTRLVNSFHSVSNKLTSIDYPERAYFPQLQTSDKLTTAEAVFNNQYNLGWRNMDTNAITNRPFTNTQNVTNFNGCFAGFQGTSIDVYMGEGTAFGNTFERCNKWTTFSPGIGTSQAMVKATNLASCWKANTLLESFPQMDFPDCTNFQSAWEHCESLTSFPLIDTSSSTRLVSAWSDCKNLTSFPELDTSNVINFGVAWNGCNVLNNIGVVPGATTSFPLLDFTNAIELQQTWYNCFALTVFPKINTPNVANFRWSWYRCENLEEFPEINTSSGTLFQGAWQTCLKLKEFPALDFSNGKTFLEAWATCRALTTFPPNMFDTTGTLNASAFQRAFTDCALTAQSIENILVSLDTNGQSNIELGIDGGTNAAKSTWTGAAVAAFDNLIAKGWTIEFNA